MILGGRDDERLCYPQQHVSKLKLKLIMKIGGLIIEQLKIKILPIFLKFLTFFYSLSLGGFNLKKTHPQNKQKNYLFLFHFILISKKPINVMFVIENSHQIICSKIIWPVIVVNVHINVSIVLKVFIQQQI